VSEVVQTARGTHAKHVVHTLTVTVRVFVVTWAAGTQPGHCNGAVMAINSICMEQNPRRGGCKWVRMAISPMLIGGQGERSNRGM
jgi:hypothetical protein